MKDGRELNVEEFAIALTILGYIGGLEYETLLEGFIKKKLFIRIGADDIPNKIKATLLFPDMCHIARCTTEYSIVSDDPTENLCEMCAYNPDAPIRGISYYCAICGADGVFPDKEDTVPMRKFFKAAKHGELIIVYGLNGDDRCCEDDPDVENPQYILEAVGFKK